ncbi:ParB-like nuclease domain protein [Mycobacterium phage Reindeer]|uniref:ParB-like nuclease domain protein n=1 Tax=Mycobacterium phage Reindeer TaxID=2762283 RepID=A0A7G8LI37_9CAUD|nr:ParB-like nuclease domain protein [Mycobacterium phage Reindeer]QNJ56909.1 ParB-like nuclease domain protein [Mycobacterium phage Reindeer]
MTVLAETPIIHVPTDVTHMSGLDIVTHIQCGDESTWEEELHYVWVTDRPHTLSLMDRIIADGEIKEPIWIDRNYPDAVRETGKEWRVYNGHHRTAIGLALQIPVPVHFSRY